MSPLRVRAAVRSQTLRTILSIGGIALCVLLMLFLGGAYRGVSDGSMEFIHRNRADLWVLQGNATNILRCTSILRYADVETIRRVPGVKSADPLLLILANVDNGEAPATVYLAGYDPATGRGGPPVLTAGRGVGSDDEIVLDRAFVRKHRLEIGDTVSLQGQRLLLVGESDGTNAFVIQYAFVSLARAWRVAGYPGIVTCFLVDVDDARSADRTANAIQHTVPGARVFAHSKFVRNNLAEMHAGFLPFVYTIAALGATVLTAILSLLLALSIMERRRDYAVMKALGAPNPYLWFSIIRQSLAIVGTGTVVAALASPALVALVGRLSPEVSVLISWPLLVRVATAAVAVGIVSAVIAMSKLRRIYALEAF